jgi:hypothetical protein
MRYYTNLIEKIIYSILIIVLLYPLIGCGLNTSGENDNNDQSTSRNIVKDVIKKDSNNETIEQRNIIKRYKIDNIPGAIKHLYIISPYSGQCILYSTVNGKVTSSNKRLIPFTVKVGNGNGTGAYSSDGYNFDGKITEEVKQPDFTYGSSGDYIYWWDVRDVYHQHYLLDGQIIHISNTPIKMGSITINLEQ